MASNQKPTETCEWCRGYQEQTAWLAGKSLAAARNALVSRRATLEDGPYNDGGTAAVADYIARMAQG